MSDLFLALLPLLVILAFRSLCTFKTPPESAHLWTFRNKRLP